MPTRPDLHAQAADTLFANLVGAIQAGKHVALVHAILDWSLGQDDLTDIITGNSQNKALSQAGGYLLDANLRQAFTAAIAQVKQEILGGAGDAYNSLLKLQGVEVTQDATLANFLMRITALEAGFGLYLKADGSVPLTAPQIGVAGTAGAHLATVMQTEGSGISFSSSTAIAVASAGAATLLATVRANEAGQPARSLLIENCYTVLLSKAAGTLTKGATLIIGYNAPDYNNIATIDLTTTANLGVAIQQVLYSMVVPAGTNIYYKVTVPQIGTAVTKYALVLRGFYTALPS